MKTSRLASLFALLALLATPAFADHAAGYDALAGVFSTASEPDVAASLGAISGRCYLAAFPDAAAPALFTLDTRAGETRLGIWGAYVVVGGKVDEAYFDRITPEHARAHVDDMFNGHGGPVLAAVMRPDGTLIGGVDQRMHFEMRRHEEGLVGRILYWVGAGSPERQPYAYCNFFNRVSTDLSR